MSFHFLYFMFQLLPFKFLKREQVEQKVEQEKWVLFHLYFLMYQGF